MSDTETPPEADRIRRLEITVGHMADGFHPRISDAERTIAELYVAVGALTARVDYLEAERKADESKGYEDLRRIIKVIGLTPLVARRGFPQITDPDDVFAWERSEWEEVCGEFYALYGHLQLDGKSLWNKPPAPPSPQTKTLIAESLKHRQEA